MRRQTLALASLALLACAGTNAADCIAIIGTGRVGSALGQRWAQLGQAVVYGSRSPADARLHELLVRSGAKASAALPREAAQSCDVVVLAVPWQAVQKVVQDLGDLKNRVLIDVTNPMAVHDHREWPIAVPDSGGERVQDWARGAHVVKALNTLNFKVMADPAIAGGPVSVPLCGDDAAAKATTAKLIDLLGLQPLDVGALRIARYTESLALLYASRLQSSEPMLFEYYLRPRAR